MFLFWGSMYFFEAFIVFFGHFSEKRRRKILRRPLAFVCASSAVCRPLLSFERRAISFSERLSPLFFEDSSVFFGVVVFCGFPFFQRRDNEGRQGFSLPVRQLRSVGFEKFAYLIDLIVFRFGFIAVFRRFVRFGGAVRFGFILCFRGAVRLVFVSVYPFCFPEKRLRDFFGRFRKGRLLYAVFEELFYERGGSARFRLFSP